MIGESDISLKEERNINNIKSMGLELQVLKTIMLLILYFYPRI